MLGICKTLYKINYILWCGISKYNDDLYAKKMNDAIITTVVPKYDIQGGP